MDGDEWVSTHASHGNNRGERGGGGQGDWGGEAAVLLPGHEVTSQSVTKGHT